MVGSQAHRNALNPTVSDPVNIPLSVLDLAPVPTGSTSARALRDSVELARHVEGLGYHRYWVAEHHNMPGIASSAPAVLIGQVAAATSTIRVGSGGVMLPNHPPLVVAEQFGMLEALHPGRIDLGIGRAPGTDGHTAAALRRTANPLSVEDFPRQLRELIDYFGQHPDGPVGPGRIHAVPAAGNRPPLWLLGSSDYSARAAGLLGLPFSFAYHFSAAGLLPALEVYRDSFRPSEVLSEPYAMVAAGVVCAETDEHAQWLAGSQGLAILRLRTGRPGTLPSPDEAAAHPFTPLDREVVDAFQASHVVGSPDTVRAGLDRLIARSGADEVMVTSQIFDPRERRRSYELLAGAAGLRPHQA